MSKFLNILIGIIGILIFQSCTKSSDHEGSSEDKNLTNPPNILLIIADDMGIDFTPGYNVGDIKPIMSNLSQLQAEGIIYDNVWSAPICAPTRASIITGKYGIHNGVLNTSSAGTIKESEKTIQAYLDEKLGKVYAHARGAYSMSNMATQV